MSSHGITHVDLIYLLVKDLQVFVGFSLDWRSPELSLDSPVFLCHGFRLVFDSFKQKLLFSRLISIQPILWR